MEYVIQHGNISPSSLCHDFYYRLFFRWKNGQWPLLLYEEIKFLSILSKKIHNNAFLFTTLYCVNYQLIINKLFTTYPAWDWIPQDAVGLLSTSTCSTSGTSETFSSGDNEYDWFDIGGDLELPDALFDGGLL